MVGWLIGCVFVCRVCVCASVVYLVGRRVAWLFGCCVCSVWFAVFGWWFDCLLDLSGACVLCVVLLVGWLVGWLLSCGLGVDCSFTHCLLCRFLV